MIQLLQIHSQPKVASPLIWLRTQKPNDKISLTQVLQSLETHLMLQSRQLRLEFLGLPMRLRPTSWMKTYVMQMVKIVQMKILSLFSTVRPIHVRTPVLLVLAFLTTMEAVRGNFNLCCSFSILMLSTHINLSAKSKFAEKIKIRQVSVIQSLLTVWTLPRHFIPPVAMELSGMMLMLRVSSVYPFSYFQIYHFP